MKVTSIVSVLILLLASGSLSHAIETKCVVTGPAAVELNWIAREAYEAQRQADEMEAYLRSFNPNWESLAGRMAYLGEHIKRLKGYVAEFEAKEPRLNDTQRASLEKLRMGLVTLTVFANNTNQLIAEKRLTAHRVALEQQVRAMSVRAELIRKAARELKAPQAG